MAELTREQRANIRKGIEDDYPIEVGVAGGTGGAGVTEPFEALWERWYQGVNGLVTSAVDPSPSVATDIIRTQFQMLDALVGHHAGCPERFCVEKAILRRELEARA